MPDALARLAVSPLSASGTWGDVALNEAVALFVEAHEVVVRVERSGDEHPAPFAALRGAGWRAGALTLYRGSQSLLLTGGDGLDRAWVALTQRACTLPEVARALRALGGNHGASAQDHARFVSPFLHARRRLEDDAPVDWRVAAFDASALAERTRAVLAAMSHERHQEQAPHRRALEARLLDACEPLFVALDQVVASARLMTNATDATRFEAWRAWAVTLRALFAETDQAWRSVAGELAHADRALGRPVSPR